MALAAILAGASAVANAAPTVLSGLQSLANGASGGIGQISFENIGATFGNNVNAVQDAINQFMAQQSQANGAQAAATAAGTGAQAAAAQNGAAAAGLGGASAGFFDSLGQKLGISPTWLKVGIFGGGALILGGGLWMLLRRRAK